MLRASFISPIAHSAQITALSIIEITDASWDSEWQRAQRSIYSGFGAAAKYSPRTNLSADRLWILPWSLMPSIRAWG